MSLKVMSNFVSKILMLGFMLLSNAFAVNSFTVDDARDLHDAIPGDGYCESIEGTCSLRAALEESNITKQDLNLFLLPQEYFLSLGTPLTIGCYDLSLFGGAADDVRSSITAANQSRILDAVETCPNHLIRIENIDLKEGSMGDGGLLFVNDRKELSIRNSSLNSGYASRFGGAIFVAETDVIIANTTFENVLANDGAAIYAVDSNVNVNNSTIFSEYGSILSGDGQCQFALTNTNLSNQNQEEVLSAGCDLAYEYNQQSQVETSSDSTINKTIKTNASYKTNAVTAAEENIEISIAAGGIDVWEISRAQQDPVRFCIEETGRLPGSTTAYTANIIFDLAGNATGNINPSYHQSIRITKAPNGDGSNCLLIDVLINDNSPVEISLRLNPVTQIVPGSATIETTVDVVDISEITLDLQPATFTVKLDSNDSTWNILRHRGPVDISFFEEQQRLPGIDTVYEVVAEYRERSGGDTSEDIVFTKTSARFSSTSNVGAITFDPELGDNSDKFIDVNFSINVISGDVIPQLDANSQNMTIALRPIRGVICAPNRDVSATEGSRSIRANLQRGVSRVDNLYRSAQDFEDEHDFLMDLPVSFQWGTDIELGGAEPITDIEFVDPTDVTFAANVASMNLDVTIVDDKFYEPDEYFRFWFDNITESNIWSVCDGDKFIKANIVNDDEKVTLNINTTGLSNGVITVKESVGTLRFSVTRTGALDIVERINADIDVTSGSAVFSEDFGQATATRTDFDNGKSVFNFELPIIDDQLHEGEENFTISLTQLGDYAELGSNGSITIVVEDDDAANVSFSNDSFLGFESSEKATVVLQRDGDLSTEDVSVIVSTSDSTASQNQDYFPLSNERFTFEKGKSELVIEIDLIDDQVIEDDETFNVALSTGDVNTTKIQGGNTALVTITGEPDTRPEVSFVASSSTIIEGLSIQHEVVLQRSNADNQISVNVSSEEITATGAVDFETINGPVVFPAGVFEMPIQFRIFNDELAEGNERFIIRVADDGSNTSKIGSESVHTVTIEDDENTGSARFVKPSKTVHYATDEVINIPFVRNEGENASVTLELEIIEGSAKAGEDFEIPSIQSITIDAEETLGYFNINLIEGRSTASEKQFIVRITSVSPLDYQIQSETVTVVLNSRPSCEPTEVFDEVDQRCKPRVADGGGNGGVVEPQPRPSIDSGSTHLGFLASMLLMMLIIRKRFSIAVSVGGQ